MSQDINISLREHNLRVTNCRKDILSIFLQSNFALSQAYLEESLTDYYDRVSIYRNLRSFEEKGLIHKVLDDFGIMKYALCQSECKEVHHHDHVHFKCLKCGRTICMDTVSIPVINLPEGFSKEEANLLVTGTCNICIVHDNSMA